MIVSDNGMFLGGMIVTKECSTRGPWHYDLEVKDLCVGESVIADTISVIWYLHVSIR